MKALQALFNPNNIAVVGASNDSSKAGNVIVKNILRKGYRKKIFPVNPKESEIIGLKAYASIDLIEESVEMVVLIMPSSKIFEVMEDLEKRMIKRKDIKVIVCSSAGFGELKTEEGYRRRNSLIEMIKKHNIRLIGPNCMGIIDNRSPLDTTFVETGKSFLKSNNKKPGISFLSQSGAFASAVLMIGDSSPVPIAFNKVLSVGNMIDIDFVDLLEYLEKDDSTTIIGVYMEGYSNPRKLIKTMSRIAHKKPVIVLKAGKTEQGASAAHSHTGSFAGSDKIYDSAFKQYGIVRVDNLEELVDTMKAFDRLPLPEGGNAFVLTQAGGPGSHCTDIISKTDLLKMPVINTDTKQRLSNLLPDIACVCKPEGYADISASANVQQHILSLKALLGDPSIDLIIFITIVPSFLPQKELGRKLGELYKIEKTHHNKPVFFTMMAGNYVLPGRKSLEKQGLYSFETPDRAVKAAYNMVWYVEYQKSCKEQDGYCE